MVESGPHIIPPRRDRFMAVLGEIDALPPAHSSIEAYGQISETLNVYEDEVFGRDHWFPPRSFLHGNRTERIYPIYPESFHPVPEFAGVTVMIAKREYVFLSRFGAIEIQEKVPGDEFGQTVHFKNRQDCILWKKDDAYGDGVWHEKNKA